MLPDIIKLSGWECFGCSSWRRAVTFSDQPPSVVTVLRKYITYGRLLTDVLIMHQLIVWALDSFSFFSMKFIKCIAAHYSAENRGCKWLIISTSLYVTVEGQNIFCTLCVNTDLCMLQRHQYPHLPEDNIKNKARIWRLCDEKEQERRQAFYRDVLAQQQSVSQFYTYKCLCVCLSVHICTIAILMFQLYSSIAHTPHSSHTEPSKKSSDADDRDHCEPAWADLNT